MCCNVTRQTARFRDLGINASVRILCNLLSSPALTARRLQRCQSNCHSLCSPKLVSGGSTFPLCQPFCASIQKSCSTFQIWIQRLGFPALKTNPQCVYLALSPNKGNGDFFQIGPNCPISQKAKLWESAYSKVSVKQREGGETPVINIWFWMIEYF